MRAITSHMIAYLNLFLRDLSLLKMPKFKYSTAAHCVHQAKKRKRSQREYTVRCHEEQECAAATRKQLYVRR